MDLPLEITDLYEMIATNQKNYNNKKDLMSVLDGMKDINDDTISQFTEIITLLTNDLIRVTNNSTLVRYKDDILDFIKKNPKNIVDTFIKNTYNKDKGNYRKQLVLQNEDFFLKQSFDEELKDKNLIDKLFQFKTFWHVLKPENKEIIKFYLSMLCSLADKRFVNHYTYIELKKSHQNFNDVFVIFDKEF